MKVREAIRLLAMHGWVLVRQRRSHRQFKHAVKPGTLAIAGNDGDDLPRGTLNSVLKQAGIRGSDEIRDRDREE